jgi:hypothetical protein
VRARAGYILIASGPGSDRARRGSALGIACVVALFWTAPAQALPLASDNAVSSAAAPGSIGPSVAPAISVWNFLHPGSTDREEPVLVTVPDRPNAYVAAEPCFVAGASSDDRADRNPEANDSVDSRSGSGGGESTQFVLGSHRAVRHSSGGPRATRTDSDSYPALNAFHSVSPPLPTPRVSWPRNTRLPSPTAFLLFRPPRAEIALS